jgi:hypothetical protein
MPMRKMKLVFDLGGWNCTVGTVHDNNLDHCIQIETESGSGPQSLSFFKELCTKLRQENTASVRRIEMNKETCSLSQRILGRRPELDSFHALQIYEPGSTKMTGE